MYLINRCGGVDKENMRISGVDIQDRIMGGGVLNVCFKVRLSHKRFNKGRSDIGLKLSLMVLLTPIPKGAYT